MKNDFTNDRKKLFSVDRMMQNVASSLIRDFRTNLDDHQFCSDHLALLCKGDLIGVRQLDAAANYSDWPAYFKAAYQIDSLFKRYRFESDLYTDDELTVKAIDGFIATQNRLRVHNLDAADTFTVRVMDKAREYIAHTLGNFDDAEHRSLCRFGKKASMGIPSRLASEAARWELPISGSTQQISWFDSEMSQVECVQEYWAAQKSSDPNRSTYLETSALKLTLVPKTFKSLRSIMPNTTIGSYMSFGIGEMIRKRLQRKGYDIRNLQMKHRVMAREASVHSLYTTADLSSASDTISIALVNALLPPDWLEILHQSRIGTVILPDGQSVESLTFCTMGIGYTFPLQTLVFLSLLKAIEATMYNRWNRRTISVYGDDLIYSSSMHHNVVRVFEQLGFVINIDKTFHEGEFRESCGGDYYRGVDVRPFQPRNGSATVGAKAYEAILYKFVNGLLARWSEYEIGRTLRYLMSEISLATNKAKIVPCDYPDDSGIKCPTLQSWAFTQEFEVSKPKHVGHGVYRFSYLRLVSDEREEVRHEPYYWVRLRGFNCPDHHENRTVYPGDVPTFHDALVDYAIDVRELVSSLITREVTPIKMVRSFLGHRLRRTSTFVTISHTGRYQRRFGTSCFEVRR